MLLVVGLGNPGKQYAGTRHNIGFELADAVARGSGDDGGWREKFSGSYVKTRYAGVDVALLKPMTFMNLSGQSVQPAAAFLKVEPHSIVVAHDELDLPFGEVRLKVGGGHAGHNGLRSLLERLGTPDFVRIRLGIGRPPPSFRGAVADFVLARFDAGEQAGVEGLLKAGLAALEAVAREGTTAAMNRVNVRPKK